MLKALPLLLSKNLDIVVLAVWDISPCPESLIRKIEKNRKITDEILENKKQEIASNVIIYNANFKIFGLSLATINLFISLVLSVTTFKNILKNEKNK